jgi:YHS domain-containing protein
MFKLIYYAILAYLIYSVWKLIQSLKKRSIGTRPKARLSGMMVKDEACDTYIPQEEALREVIDGHEYFFCSKECRKKFIEARKHN